MIEMMKPSIILLFVISLLTFATADKVPITLGYFPSWSESWVDSSNFTESNLAKTPLSTSHIFLAFAKPGLRYEKGSYNLSATGLEVPYDGEILKSVIESLNNNGTKVILSIGGGTYWPSGVPAINYTQVADLVRDVGFSGIDWDFEPYGQVSGLGSAENVQHYITFVNETRKLLPKSEGFLIAVAPMGYGALGGYSRDDPNSPYRFANRNILTDRSDYFLYDYSTDLSLFGFYAAGHMIPVFERIGDEIDIVAYQGYNIGGAPNRYLPYQSFAYYANKHGFVVAAGVHVPYEAWGPYHVSNALSTAQLAKKIIDTPDRRGKGDGIMVWQMLAISTYAGEETHTGNSYLNIARNVFNGQTPADAVSNAFNYPSTSVPASYTYPPTPSTTTTASSSSSSTSTVSSTSTSTASSSSTSTVSSTSTSTSSTSSSASPASSASSSSTQVLPWSASTIYGQAGIKVTYNGRTYESRYYTVNEVPDSSPAWRDVTPFDPNNIPAWSSSKTYDGAGYIVSHNGQNYISKWWTQGNEPGNSDAWKLYP